MMNAEARQKVRVPALITAILIPLLTGVFSAVLTAKDMKIYGMLNQPALAPPAWLFPIVWTILYAVMGTASYFVYRSDADIDKKRKALMFYGIQLAMNFFWSTLFFTYSRYLLALVWLFVMWILILITAVRFYFIRRAAGIMMGSLFLWTAFAGYLNLAIYAMNISPMPIIA